MRHEDLLSRLTGRAFKGRQFVTPYQPGRPAPENAAGVPSRGSGGSPDPPQNGLARLWCHSM